MAQLLLTKTNQLPLNKPSTSRPSAINENRIFWKKSVNFHLQDSNKRQLDAIF